MTTLREFYVLIGILVQIVTLWEFCLVLISKKAYEKSLQKKKIWIVLNTFSLFNHVLYAINILFNDILFYSIFCTMSFEGILISKKMRRFFSLHEEPVEGEDIENEIRSILKFLRIGITIAVAYYLLIEVSTLGQILIDPFLSVPLFGKMLELLS